MATTRAIGTVMSDRSTSTAPDLVVIEPTLGAVGLAAMKLLTPPEDVGSSPSEWSITVTQELPGILPPVVVHGPDGGLVVNYDLDAGDSLGGIGDASATGAGSSALPDSGVTCVPTTCAEQNATCAEIPDGFMDDVTWRHSLWEAGGSG